MKKYLLPLLSLLLFACPSDDDNITQLPNVIETNLDIDVNAIIALPDGSDISNLVDFGNGPGLGVFNYQVELNLGDSFVLRQPLNVGSNVTLWYSRLDFSEPDPADPGAFIPVPIGDVENVWVEFLFPDLTDIIEDPLLPPGSGFGVSKTWTTR